eukprot:1128341-Pleurochrysis_carterae.AAC.1
MLERVRSMMLRIARSATPFNWWTCGGHVVACMPSSARNSVNCLERNSPALSLWSVPTTRVGVSRPSLSRAVNPARKCLMCDGASLLFRIKCTALTLVRSSTITRA